MYWIIYIQATLRSPSRLYSHYQLGGLTLQRCVAVRRRTPRREANIYLGGLGFPANGWISYRLILLQLDEAGSPNAREQENEMTALIQYCVMITMCQRQIYYIRGKQPQSKMMNINPQNAIQ